jgi:hypothetical protein
MRTSFPEGVWPNVLYRPYYFKKHLRTKASSREPFAPSPSADI